MIFFERGILWNRRQVHLCGVNSDLETFSSVKDTLSVNEKRAAFGFLLQEDKHCCAWIVLDTGFVFEDNSVEPLSTERPGRDGYERRWSRNIVHIPDWQQEIFTSLWNWALCSIACWSVRSFVAILFEFSWSLFAWHLVSDPKTCLPQWYWGWNWPQRLFFIKAVLSWYHLNNSPTFVRSQPPGSLLSYNHQGLLNQKNVDQF